LDAFRYCVGASEQASVGTRVEDMALVAALEVAEAFKSGMAPREMAAVLVSTMVVAAVVVCRASPPSAAVAASVVVGVVGVVGVAAARGVCIATARAYHRATSWAKLKLAQPARPEATFRNRFSTFRFPKNRF
jgi:hypothetical protein